MKAITSLNTLLAIQGHDDLAQEAGEQRDERRQKNECIKSTFLVEKFLSHARVGSSFAHAWLQLDHVSMKMSHDQRQWAILHQLLDNIIHFIILQS